MYLPTLAFIQGFKAASQDEVCAIAEVSTIGIKTQVSGLKNVIFSFLAVLLKWLVLVTAKSGVTIGPIS